MPYLKGELLSITTESLRAVEGKKVRYLTKYDIDTSGRGYFFPRENVIHYVKSRQVVFVDSSSVMMRNLIEIQLVNP